MGFCFREEPVILRENKQEDSSLAPEGSVARELEQRQLSSWTLFWLRGVCGWENLAEEGIDKGLRIQPS